MVSKKCEKAKLDSKRTIDFSRLPPTRSCLEEHVKRANYQVRIWKLARQPEPHIPDATDDNGWTIVNGVMEPKWFTGEVVPRDVAGLWANMQNNVGIDDDSMTEDENIDNSELSSDCDSDSDSDHENCYSESDSENDLP